MSLNAVCNVCGKGRGPEPFELTDLGGKWALIGKCASNCTISGAPTLTALLNDKEGRELSQRGTEVGGALPIAAMALPAAKTLLGKVATKAAPMVFSGVASAIASKLLNKKVSSVEDASALAKAKISDLAVHSANKAAGAAVDVATQQLQKQGSSILKRLSNRKASVPVERRKKQNRKAVEVRKLENTESDGVDLSAI